MIVYADYRNPTVPGLNVLSPRARNGVIWCKTDCFGYAKRVFFFFSTLRAIYWLLFLKIEGKLSLIGYQNEIGTVRREISFVYLV